MGDENNQGTGTVDSSDLSTAERAYDWFMKDDQAAGGDGKVVAIDRSAAPGAAAAQPGDGAQAGADGKTVDPKAQADGAAAPGGPKPGEPGQITDEQLNAHPKFKELSEFRDNVQLLMEAHSIPDTKEMGLQLADADVLYKIAVGQARPSDLLNLMAGNAQWTKEQTAAVAGDLIDWLTKGGYLKEGHAQAGGQGKDGKFVDPLEERLDRLERERREGEQRTQRERVTAEQKAYQTKIFNAYTDKITELMKGAGLVDDKGNVDKMELAFYVDAVRNAVPSQEHFNAIVKRIEKGNFVDVQKYFDTIRERETKRLQKHTKHLTDQHTRKEGTIPRVSTGGASPTPAGKQKRNLANRDDRLAAAEEAWDY